MKKNILLIFLSLVSSLCFSQINEELSLKELHHLGFEVSNSIDNYPEEEKLLDSSAVHFGTLLGDDGYFVCLLFTKNDSLFHRSSIIKLPDEEEPYRCKRPFCDYEDSTLLCECRWMRGIHFVQKYNVTKGQLTYAESYQYDLNKKVYEQAEEAKKKDDPIAYCIAFSGAQFYSMDINSRGIESLMWAHSKALKNYNKENFKEAAAIMLKLDSTCWVSTCENLSPQYPDKTKEAWGDATLFYLKAKEFQDCIELCERLIKIYPSNTGIYLQYGDALYETKNRNFIQAYSTYVDLMKDSENKIPSRVLNRLKE